MKKLIKILLRILLTIILVLVIAVGGMVGFLQVTEYRPKAEEGLAIRGDTDSEKVLREGDTLRIMTFNIGYGALDKDHDFFMDGGQTVNTESRQTVLANMQGIADTVYGAKTDIVFLQEVDRNSTRSYRVDEADYMQEAYPNTSMAYAANFRVGFIPYPIPPIGKVEGGIVTLNTYAASSAERISLPTSFSWPVRLAQLKRCLLVERVPVQDSDKELVLINLHLEAYDDGAGKEAQTRILFDILREEYKKGNYCIAGGDFNQTFDQTGLEEYPIKDTTYFQPGSIDTAELGTGWTFACDVSTPTSRLLNEPFDPGSDNTQYYMLDGFILSPNVTMENVKTMEEEFTYSDHNPVTIKVTLQEDEK